MDGPNIRFSRNALWKWVYSLQIKEFEMSKSEISFFDILDNLTLTVTSNL